MQSDPYLAIEQIEKAASLQELESLLDILVDIGKPAITATLEKMPSLVTSRLHSVGAKLFARIGYPNNAEALKFLVSDASNPNSSTWEISRGAILAIGAPALSEIADALEFYRRDVEFYNIEIDTLKDLENVIKNSQESHS